MASTTSSFYFLIKINTTKNNKLFDSTPNHNCLAAFFTLTNSNFFKFYSLILDNVSLDNFNHLTISLSFELTFLNLAKLYSIDFQKLFFTFVYL